MLTSHCTTLPEYLHTTDPVATISITDRSGVVDVKGEVIKTLFDSEVLKKLVGEYSSVTADVGNMAADRSMDPDDGVTITVPFAEVISQGTAPVDSICTKLLAGKAVVAATNPA